MFAKTTARLVLAAAALALASAAQAQTISQWSQQHTEAPSRFSPPVTLSRPTLALKSASGPIFTAPASGPAGAQFGRLPATNNSFVYPTINSVQARQTQNSTQASNTQMSSQAVQGRNCTLNAIRAGLCAGR